MKIIFLGLMLLCCGMAYGQTSIGIAIGAPPQPLVEAHTTVPPSVEYTWVGGYWYPFDDQYVWHAGYWSLPPYSGNIWVAPRYDGHYYYQGYWSDKDGNVAHDHKWDTEHDRNPQH